MGSTVAWRRTDEYAGHSMAGAQPVADGSRWYGAEVLVTPDEAISCTFTVRVDAGWLTREVEVDAVSAAGPTRLVLRADGDRSWWRDGDPAPELAGCVDVDIAATPLTNTFPINRLRDLPVGSAATAPVAWVEVPSLRVHRVEQTYRRLAARRWEYSDPMHGSFVLEVDDAGLVTDYEGFATRV